MKAFVQFLKVWVPGLMACILLDFIFLGYIAAGFYRHHLEPFLEVVEGSMTVNVPAAIATWALLTAGIYMFVLPRAATSGGALHALFWGAVYGAVVYGVYDLTNYATLKGWPFIVVAFDMTWGACLCAVLSLWMQFISRCACCKAA